MCFTLKNMNTTPKFLFTIDSVFRKQTLSASCGLTLEILALSSLFQVEK